MSPARRTHVAVFGASAADVASGAAGAGGSAVAGEDILAVAEELGRAIAGAGWTLVNGGYGGTMLAGARGAAGAGGRVIGVTCSIFKSPPNEFLTQVVRTDNLFDRLRAIIELGDAYLVLPGSTGTLAELALVWELVSKRLLPPRPILCWGEMWRPIVGVFGNAPTRDPRLPSPAPAERRSELITFVYGVEEAVRLIRREFGNPG